jgi:hypothetical protein
VHPIYRWNGEYFGFIEDDHLFNTKGNFLGWISDDGRVWKKDGDFLGELVDDIYILRRQSMPTPTRRTRKLIPPRPAIPAKHAKQAKRAKKAGWDDALDEF